MNVHISIATYIFSHNFQVLCFVVSGSSMFDVTTVHSQEYVSRNYQ